MFDHLQSDNYEPESYPGAGDGKGWRLSKNGDCQLGDFSMVNGEIFSRHGNVRVDNRQYELGLITEVRIGDDQSFLDEKHLREAGIEPATIWPKRVYLTQEQIEAAKCALPPHIVHKPGASRAHQVMATQCDLEVIVRVDLPEGADPANAEGYAHKIRQIVIDTINSSEVLQGMRSGRVTTEATVRAETDSALASRISGMRVLDEWTHPVDGVGLPLPPESAHALAAAISGVKPGDGQEFLYVKQPGGPVEIGDLQKCCGRDTFTEQFLNREVRSDMKPEVVCALSMAAPMTANGKVPINNLPRHIDDVK
ncbi:hypothetical protein HOS55_gp113 [Pseudomonas phage PMBT3]|uniref:Uncharacterized protein n=1 Tax=Pseudomonas phage PMBT3 TaxID=2059856 RepID=A0A2I6PI27_9CAUD|nr:hypothetical protein HOS55_gp113 [Pseudomonas phage PMBT3]AUM59715.1 hypothetical protein [Pseudomonas phage PMBT3]